MTLMYDSVCRSGGVSCCPVLVGPKTIGLYRFLSASFVPLSCFVPILNVILLWNTLFFGVLVGIGSMDGCLSRDFGWVTPCGLLVCLYGSVILLRLSSGRYMSELELEQRVEDMVQTRQNMMDQLEYRVLQDQKQQEESRRKPRKQLQQ
jgi:hypothetical protein